MKTLASIAITLGLFAFSAAYAAAPASAPAGTNGQCKDGTWSSAAAKKGACHGHQGVKEWYATDAASASTSTADTATTSSSTSSKKKHADSSSASTSTAAASSSASAPTGAPANATGLCNDGTYYTGENKKGACHGHKGVKTWYGASTASTSTTTMPAAKPAPAAMPAPTPPASTTMSKSMPAAAPAAAPAMPSTTSTASTPSATPAPGGGVGKVWVNTSSKVYHCQGDRYYGTTKAGEYMTEADAAAKGNRPAHGKSCSS